MEKYLSIITNFGCHYECPYCIVKNNNIDVPETTLESLMLLKEKIVESSANIVSISGGGDPLYNYIEHKDYYDKLYGVCSELNIPIEMHTSYIDSQFPYEKCKRVVYHLNHTNQLRLIKRYGEEIVRVVFVVTCGFSRETIEWISGYVEQSNDIDELSFRQLVDKQYKLQYYQHDFLIWGHQKGFWHYIQQNDYNTYFVEGKLYYRFADIGKLKMERRII